MLKVCIHGLFNNSLHEVKELTHVLTCTDKDIHPTGQGCPMSLSPLGFPAPVWELLETTSLV